MKIVKIHLQKLLFLAVVSTVLGFGFPAAAQEMAADGNTNQSATPIPAPTPIAPSDIVSQAAAEKRLEEIQSISQSPGVQFIGQELPKLKQTLDLRTTETTQILSARPSLETLRTTEQAWRALSKDINSWKKDLKAQIGVFDKQIEELKNQHEVWQKPLNALKNPAQSNTATQTENAAEVPPEVLQRINEIIAAIAKTHKPPDSSRKKGIPKDVLENMRKISNFKTAPTVYSSREWIRRRTRSKNKTSIILLFKTVITLPTPKVGCSIISPVL